MIQVIDENNNETKTGCLIRKCWDCDIILSYEDEDIKCDYETTPLGTIHWKYIVCPKCKNEIQWM